MTVTPEEKEAILAERKRKADEVKKAEREALQAKHNKEADKNKAQFEAALRAIKSTTGVLTFELSEIDSLVRGRGLEEGCHKAGKLVEKLCVKMEIGMEAFVTLSKKGAVDASQTNAGNGSKTFMSACRAYPPAISLIVETAINKMETVESKYTEENQRGGGEQVEEEAGRRASKRKRV